MKAKVSSLLTAALLASLTSSALAEPTSTNVRTPRQKPATAEKKTVAPRAVAAMVQVTPLATHVSRSSSAQRFKDDIALRLNQEKIPLMLRVSNGSAGNQPFQWFRMRLNGELLLSEKSLKGKSEASIDVSGLIPNGSNQLIIDAAGLPGATMTWQLITYPMNIVSVEPAAATPGGTVTIKGTNFATDTNQVNVIVNGSVADVVSTTATTMVIKLPETAAPGSVNMEIQANGLPKIDVPVVIAGVAAPVVKGTNMWAAPAGTEIIISGKFFSKNPSENQVFFNNVPGQVTSAAADFLKVVVPALGGVASKPQAVPVFVVSNGMRSAGSVSFSIGPKSVDQNYKPSAVFPQQDTQNSSSAASVTSTGATFNASASPSSDPTSESGFPQQAQSQAGGVQINPVDLP